MDDWLSRKIASFEPELRAMGCIDGPQDLPLPTLKNRIHPIFDLSRWMRGYGQPTHTYKAICPVTNTPETFYSNMTPALKLASLFLTERSTLPWWTHLAYGRCKEGPVRDGTGRRYMYISDVAREQKPEALERTESKLLDLAEVITFMFTPASYKASEEGRCWGVTISNDLTFPWSHKFRRSDYTHIPRHWLAEAKQGLCIPEITMSSDFADFFAGAHTRYTRSQAYRVQFLFAVTLVHELAHAFYMFVIKTPHPGLRGDEPCWNPSSPRAELGFSWESIVIGRICNPLFGTILNSPPLCSIKTYMWQDEDVETSRRIADLLERIQSQRGTTVRRVPLGLHDRMSVPTHYWRGNQYFCDDAAAQNRNYLCIVHAIPVAWIVCWFSEDWWERKRYRESRSESGEYRPPGLGPTWTLLYWSGADRQVEMRVVSGGGMDPYLQDVWNLTAGMGLYGGYGRY